MKVKYNHDVFDLKEYLPENYSVINGNKFSINKDGYSKNCYVSEDKHSLYVFIDGKSFQFEKLSENRDFAQGDNGSSSDRDEIKPPMPGSVVKILVETGQKIEEGEGLIIVEAMKMETTIYSSITGVVTEINVKPAEQVDSNKVMIVIEKIQQQEI